MVPPLSCCGGGVDNRLAVLCSRACGILALSLERRAVAVMDGQSVEWEASQGAGRREPPAEGRKTRRRGGCWSTHHDPL